MGCEATNQSLTFTTGVLRAQSLVEHLRQQQAQLLLVPTPGTTPAPGPTDHAPTEARDEESKKEAPEVVAEVEAPELVKDKGAKAEVDSVPEASEESRKRQDSITKNTDQAIMCPIMYSVGAVIIVWRTTHF